MKSVLIYDQDIEVIKQGRDNLQDLLSGNDYSINRIYALIGFLDWMILRYAILGEIMDEWISVNERLPKAKGYYLVTRKNPKGHVTRVSYDPSRVERGVYNSPWGNGDCDVLAWMELPKPYEVR